MRPFTGWARGLVMLALAIMPRLVSASPASDSAGATPARAKASLRVLAVFVGAPADAQANAMATPDPGAAMFAHAVVAAGIGAPQPLAPDEAPPSRARALLASAEGKLATLAFPDAIAELNSAIAEAALTGAAGLDTRELDDLFLLRGAAAMRAGDAGRARAWEDFVRAATLAPTRVLDAGRFPPAVTETWTRAATEARRRPRGTLVVRAAPGALIRVDGREGVASGAPALFPDLGFGEHYLRVERKGHAPWAAVTVLAAPSTDLEVPPLAPLGLSNPSVAAVGRAASVPFVLGAQTLWSADEPPALELALVDTMNAVRHGAVTVSLAGGQSPVDEAVRRLLDAEGLRVSAAPNLSLASPPRAADAAPLGAPAPQDRSPPLFHRWWLWVAVGALAAGAVIAAVAIAHGGDSGPATGFSVTADPRAAGK